MGNMVEATLMVDKVACPRALKVKDCFWTLFPRLAVEAGNGTCERDKLLTGDWLANWQRDFRIAIDRRTARRFELVQNHDPLQKVLGEDKLPEQDFRPKKKVSRRTHAIFDLLIEDKIDDIVIRKPRVMCSAAMAAILYGTTCYCMVRHLPN